MTGRVPEEPESITPPNATATADEEVSDASEADGDNP
jgi:hypothetical protein